MNFFRSVMVCLSIATSIVVVAQNPLQQNFQGANPVSPEVAAFAKNVDIPMSYGSGTPQISIPFYTLKSGSIEVPVSLSYNASGIRVDEAATWVGLGWNLSTGPSLVRVVRGLPDEDGNGFMNPTYRRTIKFVQDSLIEPAIVAGTEEGGGELLDIEIDQNAGSLDFEPDLFTYSAFGYSGQFFWSQDSAKFVFMPYTNIKLEGSPGLGFTLILPNGIKCYFGNTQESREIFKSSTSTRVNDGYVEAAVTSSNPYVSAWYITTVIDPTGKSINFNYSKDIEYSQDFSRGGESKGNSRKYYPNTWVMFFSVQRFEKPIITSISAENGSINFLRHSTIREDVYTGTAGKTLDTLKINDPYGSELKSFLFNYYYTTSRDSVSLWGLEQYAGTARKRLWLHSITEKNIVSGLALPPYEFFYNTALLPSRLSSSQDYWGYYNGKTNSYSLLPRHLFNNTQGADRRINTDSAQAGILRKIKYPTGGTTSYFYESNDAITNMYYSNHDNFYKQFWGNPDGWERPDVIDKSHTFFPLIPASGPYNGIYTDTFSIGMKFSKLKLTPHFPAPCSVNADPISCHYTLYIKSLPDSAITYTINTLGTAAYDLPNGSYKLVLQYNQPDTMPNFSALLEWQEVPDSFNFLIGGLRVSKIISSDSAGNTISRSFKYKWPNSVYSSGIPAGIPCHLVYGSNYYFHGTGAVGFSLESNSMTPLTADGQIVHYMFATEYYDTLQSSYKTEYAFIQDMPELTFGPSYSIVPVTRSWLNNLLWRKIVFEKTSSDYRVLSDQRTNYTSFQENGGMMGLHDIYLNAYEYVTERFLPIGTERTDYSYINGDTLTTTSVSGTLYNNEFLPANIITTTSKGDTVHTKTWYPNDYNDISGYNIQTLIDKNIIAVPIKNEVSINGKIKNGNILKYNASGLPVSVYNYEGTPLSDTVNHSRSTMLESGYNLKATVGYDIDLNIQQLETNNAPTQVYIWGYNGLLDGSKINVAPIAVVQNADSNNVAHTSFETGGGWNYSGSTTEDATAPTGNRCYQLGSNSLTKSNLTSTITYIVSYWSKNGSYTVTGSNSVRTGRTVNGWTYYEHQVSEVSSVTISGSGYIDEVRLYPKGAFMTTYTYKFPTGITSQCDANNRITYYEYDALGRLHIIRDQDKNIIKVVDYQYQTSSNQ